VSLNEKNSVSSFYPGCGDDSHILARLDKANFHAPPVDDENSETDDNSMEDDNTVEFALKQPNKFSESLAIEVSMQQLYATDC
jgi:hypothetical protein